LTATIGVHFGCGSRQDTLATTGVAHALRLMLSRGTSSRGKADFAQEIEAMGARYSGETGREHTNVEVTCFKSDVRKVVGMLGDVISSANLDPAEFELTK
jgi:predicted Zn-dependent peptidase